MYSSTTTYNIDKFVEPMGNSSMIRVTDDTGMVVAILPEVELALQYKEILTPQV